MNRSEFTEAAPGRLVRIADGCEAFVPNPLPPGLPPPSTGLTHALVDAAMAIGQLKQALSRAGLDPLMVVYALIRREAVFSNAIEGSYTSPQQLALFEASAASGGRPVGDMETREVWNHFTAMQEALRSLQTADEPRPLSTHILRAAHKTLMRGTPEATGSGELRKFQNAIGRPGAPFTEARFIPPPPQEVEHLLDALISFCNSIGTNRTIHPLIAVALAHYQFETIHPFMDGNGRLGRFFVTLTMTAKGILPEPLLYVSAWLHKNKSTYVDLMLAVSQKGAWDAWLSFFMKALEESAKDGLAVCSRLLDLKESLHNRVPVLRASTHLHDVVDLLFENWVITIKEVEEKTKRTEAMAGVYLKKMIQMGMLREITGGKKNLRFMNDEMMRIAFEP